MESGNRVMVAASNTVLFEKSRRFGHQVVDGASRHSAAALDSCRYTAGQRVLDVGCWFGNTTQRIAMSVGPAGEAVAWDCAEHFARVAEADARENMVNNARFVVGDTQVDDLHGPYDHAFASFGAMFFASPVAAIRNVRGALKPDAIEFAMALDPAGEMIRLAGEEGARRTPEVMMALREVLAPFVGPDGVWAPSRSWFIAASNPA